jgi:small subunit ribosomal protein S16
MTIKIRLARSGAKKKPYYRIVVANSTAPRDGRFIEKIGNYNPVLPKEDENRVVIDQERAKYWISVGAQPTDRISKLLKKPNSSKGKLPANDVVKKKVEKKSVINKITPLSDVSSANKEINSPQEKKDEK